MRIQAPAKINLGLYVTGKRKDGFHNLETLFIPISLADALDIKKSDEFSLEVDGIGIPGLAPNSKENVEANLCYKAWKMMDVRPVSIKLTKNIPAKAGLGGGSSDAVSTMLMLRDMFETSHSFMDLFEIALELGSDCPFFLKKRPSLGKGRGEIFEDVNLNLKGLSYKIVIPDFEVSTPYAFSKIKSFSEEGQLSHVLALPKTAWKDMLKNDFEEALRDEFPLIQETIDGLYKEGAIYAGLTGSGSACFGIFDKSPKSTGFYSGKFL